MQYPAEIRGGAPLTAAGEHLTRTAVIPTRHEYASLQGPFPGAYFFDLTATNLERDEKFSPSCLTGWLPSAAGPRFISRSPSRMSGSTSCAAAERRL
jgi:hypothetical protein